MQEGKGKVRSGSELLDVFEVSFITYITDNRSSLYCWNGMCNAKEFSLFSFLIKDKLCHMGAYI